MVKDIPLALKFGDGTVVVPDLGVGVIIIHNHAPVFIRAHGRIAGGIGNAGGSACPAHMRVDKIVDSLPLDDVSSFVKKVFFFCDNVVPNGSRIDFYHIGF